MPSRLHSRLTKLEARAMATEVYHGQGLAALLAFARRHGLAKDITPLKALSGAELDAKIAALTGHRGFALLLREHLEAERARRQVPHVATQTTERETTERGRNASRSPLALTTEESHLH